MLLRRIARPMLAAWFVTEGTAGVRGAPAHLEPTRVAVDALAEPIGFSRPDDEGLRTIVKVHGGLMIAAGAALAVGKAPRLAAGLLAVLALPAAVANLLASRREGTSPEARAELQQRAVLALSFTGAALLAAADREGRPGLAWKMAHAKQLAAAGAATGIAGLGKSGAKAAGSAGKASAAAGAKAVKGAKAAEAKAAKLAGAAAATSAGAGAKALKGATSAEGTGTKAAGKAAKRSAKATGGDARTTRGDRRAAKVAAREEARTAKATERADARAVKLAAAQAAEAQKAAKVAERAEAKARKVGRHSRRAEVKAAKRAARDAQDVVAGV